ncbi:TetR family transcriptional regulator [Barrientosiimonas humi]|uniref:TetR family transcriptional regulator n=1 Tax=Barrientosiimonas humi TaxID=999931 RepID=A0A542XG21_9MICO|nr:TetR family transcriptional regulator [Barrientosiimonas humi]TQL34773.1 TetR family transcriptional regulator [Barrientosiimonas humi]CAG7570859.1 HTH-type transcriptional regulator RcdA [Barrientosiimonas humi]
MATPKGERRRAAVVAAAARLVLSDGPAALTHRRVAEAAQVPLAATTYYFSGRDELLAAAGERIVDSWVVAAERVAKRAVAEATGVGEPARAYGGLVDDLITALLPPKVGEIRGHYEHLVGAGRDRTLARAYRAGRAQLDAATAKILAAHGVSAPPDLVLAVLDGAVVIALSEGRQVRAYARDTLLRALTALDPAR